MDPNPERPVHDQLEFGFAASAAPRFRSSSEIGTQVMLTARESHGLRMPVGLLAVAMEFGCVSKTLQHRIVPGRLEELQDRPKDLVQDRIGVPDVKIERKQGATEMEFRLIIQRA